jgi:hypothetical protein
MASVQASLAAIETLYSTSTSKNAPPRRHSPLAPLMALTLTPAEIEELIAVVIAAGSALVPKIMSLRGQTDAELLASATADDAEAESQAKADGGTEGSASAPWNAAPDPPAAS